MGGNATTESTEDTENAERKKCARTFGRLSCAPVLTTSRTSLHGDAGLFGQYGTEALTPRSGGDASVPTTHSPASLQRCDFLATHGGKRPGPRRPHSGNSNLLPGMSLDCSRAS